MNLIQPIREIFRNGTGGKSEIKGKLNPSEDSPAASQDSQRFQQILHGMGTGTARIVIDELLVDKQIDSVQFLSRRS